MCWMVRLPGRPELAQSTLLLSPSSGCASLKFLSRLLCPSLAGETTDPKIKHLKPGACYPRPVTRVRNAAKSSLCRCHRPQFDSGIDMLIVSRLPDRDADTGPGSNLTPRIGMR